MVLNEHIYSLEAGQFHSSGLRGFPKEQFVNVVFSSEGSVERRSLLCSNGHLVGCWSERPTAGFYPHLCYLSPDCVKLPWKR